MLFCSFKQKYYLFSLYSTTACNFSFLELRICNTFISATVYKNKTSQKCSFAFLNKKCNFLNGHVAVRLLKNILYIFSYGIQQNLNQKQ